MCGAASHGAPAVLPTRRGYRACVGSADPITFVVAVVIAAAISLGVFAHADRHGSSHATAWGIAAFLAAGVAVPVYFIRYWARRRRSA